MVSSVTGEIVYVLLAIAFITPGLGLRTELTLNTHVFSAYLLKIPLEDAGINNK